MLTPTILSMGLRRVPGMIQGAARGLEQAPATMREALMQQSGPQQSVAEILSEGLPEMTPNLGKATSAASRQRQIADMLLQGAQQQDNTSIAGGLSQLGQAFLARRAGQKADTAEDKQREMASLLLQQAMGGGPESQAARAQLFADNPAAMVAQSDAARRQALEDTRYVDELNYLRARDETADERAARLEAEETRRFNATFGLSEREVAAAEAEASSNSGAGSYGLTPVYGRDKNGKRVLLQTNKAGGVIQSAIPEGVVLEDDYTRAFDRTSGTEAAKKAAYETTAGRALSAFENKAELLVSQIDTAISQTNSMNTGLIGQFIAAGDLDGTMDAIGAKAMLSELIAIKGEGGTMGALSDSEGAALRNAAVNVARSQSEQQLDANLRTYRLQVEKTRMAMKKAFEDEYVNGPNAVRGPAAPAAPAANDTHLLENIMNMYLPR